MKLVSKIPWCEASSSGPVIGCPGCELYPNLCYAANGTVARVLRKKGVETFGPNGTPRELVKFYTDLKRLNKLCVCDNCHEAFPFI